MHKTRFLCDFENGMCTWYNLPQRSGRDDFDWITGSGQTKSWGTGPVADHTGSQTRKYIYIEASKPNQPGWKARLVSNVFKKRQRTGECFLFWYNMYGQHVGELNVYINSTRGGEQKVWSQKGNKGKKWTNGQVYVGAGLYSYKVIVEATIGNGFRGDITVDDFTFKTGKCAIVPSDAIPGTVVTTLAPTTVAKTQPTQAPIFGCDFEFGLCSSWSQDKKTDTIDWTMGQGSTGSVGTGPRFDHTKKNAFGKYLYLEASYKRANDSARLISTTIPATGDTGGKCLVFYYHMYGPHVNTLNVYVMLGGHLGKALWTRTGTQGNKWIKGKVTLVGRQPFQAVIEATRGPGYQGDIAIDDISLTTQKCEEESTTCTFEKDQCGYRDDTSGQTTLPWTWQSKATASTGTGPSTDHTLQSSNGFYMYVEASSQKKGTIARLYSPIEPATTGKCLSFWYHMYGRHMGTLSVYLSINNKMQQRPIWSESGNKGNVWKVASKTISSTDTFEILFEGRVENSYLSDIALDDVKIVDGPGPGPGDCDFESGICTYSNSKQGDFDWMSLRETLNVVFCLKLTERY